MDFLKPNCFASIVSEIERLMLGFDESLNKFVVPNNSFIDMVNHFNLEERMFVHVRSLV